ncbi:MAG: hypothetical protein QNJ41_08815 [Xenococcaceae cyanobacterium MO_188.B32]|nr:hypothetical protein [Xenococcaceae cyanobacterium MO_188.B32]
MKTAISIPDPLFYTAENIAKRLGISRSELYARALESFIKNRDKQDITEALNSVYENQSSSLDSEIMQMQSKSLHLYL